jgi:hypothetical protein
MRAGTLVLGFCITAMTLVCNAGAQWSVVNLHPVGATQSWAAGVRDGQLVGSAVVGGVERACLWSGSSLTWTDLHPPGAEASRATSTSGSQQAGFALSVDSRMLAGLWSGTSTSYTDLSPPGAAESMLHDVDGASQVGWANIAGVPRASMWNGSAESWIDLSPTGAGESVAIAAWGGEQVGYAVTNGVRRASVWHGTAASWVDLSPAGATYSEALGTDGLSQVGTAVLEGVQRAGMWEGTAASWVDLHPLGAEVSVAFSVWGAYQAGYVVMDGQRAGIWSGSAGSWVDLHSVLPSHFSLSEAHGIFDDGTTLFVVGSGTNTSTQRVEALMWTRLLPCRAPEVRVPPTSTITCRGDSTSFTVTATGTAPHFQWRKNEVDIPGATDATLTFTSVTLADAGSYDCIISNACGTATSNPATLTVRTPQILTQPASQTVNVDQPVFFALEADPQHPCFANLAYRWQRRNPVVEDDTAPNAWLDLSDGGGFAGTHSASLAIFRPTPGLATGYRCKITNACGCEADSNGVFYTDTINFAAACPSDFNNDGSVDGDDVIEFFGRWDSGC